MNRRDDPRAEYQWQRGDVVLDDSGNLFCYHNRHGWFGLASNQTSARGRFEWDELAHPVRLVFHLNPPPRMAAWQTLWRRTE